MKTRSLLTALLIGGISIAGHAAGGSSEFSANIRYTDYGIPHIKADDFKGAGYGAGYAFAKENFCLFADHVVTLKGERSKYFGPEESYVAPFVLYNNDGPVNNFASDAYFRFNYSDKQIAYVEKGLSEEAKQLFEGFVAGYNRQFKEFKNSDVAPSCINEPWVRELTIDDVYRRAQNVNILETGDLFRTAIPAAVPPVKRTAEDTESAVSEPVQIAMAMHDLMVGGSNVFAFGKEATENGKGLLFSNPHFPWFSTERQYVMHLTVGEEYDVMGSTLLGLPVPLAGWNETMAWAITYSTDQRFALYELDLVEGDPTKYVVDGQIQDMVPTVLTIPVLEKDGTVGQRQHTVYSTDFGTVLSAGPFQWTHKNAYALMDFSIGNNRMVDQYIAIGKAKTVREVKAAQDEYLGLQFSNLGAADASGETLYTNMSVTADYSDEKIKQCFAGKKAESFFAAYASLLFKSTRACLPDVDKASPQPGVIPANRRPFVFRDDYVLNTNASHWIVNADPSSYLSGFNKTIGNENATRGERTRAAIKMVEARLNGADGLSGNKMTQDHFLKLFYSGHNNTAQLVLDDIVADCEANPIVETEYGPYDVSEACAVLAKWDRKNGVDSVGAIIFEVFTQLLPRRFAVDYLPQDKFWKVPFDPARPLETPHGFKVHQDIRVALAKAVYMIRQNNIALDTPYGEVHGSKDRDGKFHGLPGGRGLLHAINISHEEGKGLTGPVVSGNSYMNLVSFTDEGPNTKFVLAYSQASDPKSPHFMDQFPLYAKGEWIDMPFTEKQLSKVGFKQVWIEE